jgi:hypothetical protein
MTRFVDRFEIRCDQDWDRMEPRGDGRHCGHCDRTVIDLTRLTRKQAQPYLRSKESICVRTMLDIDDEPLFRIEPKKSVGILTAAAIAIGCTAQPQEEMSPEPPEVAAVPDDASVMQPTTLPVGIAPEEIDPQSLVVVDTASDAAPAAVNRPKYRPIMGRMMIPHGF